MSGLNRSDTMVVHKDFPRMGIGYVYKWDIDPWGSGKIVGCDVYFPSVHGAEGFSSEEFHRLLPIENQKPEED